VPLDTDGVACDVPEIAQSPQKKAINRRSSAPHGARRAAGLRRHAATASRTWLAGRTADAQSIGDAAINARNHFHALHQTG